jgi:hypothetical protein
MPSHAVRRSRTAAKQSADARRTPGGFAPAAREVQRLEASGRARRLRSVSSMQTGRMNTAPSAMLRARSIA